MDSERIDVMVIHGVSNRFLSFAAEVRDFAQQVFATRSTTRGGLINLLVPDIDAEKA